jgi:hypothetical protein
MAIVSHVRSERQMIGEDNEEEIGRSMIAGSRKQKASMGDG